MEAEDPLSELADIHLPDAVDFWPPAPGWWVLAALVVFALVLLYRHQLARVFVRRRLGSALRELDAALKRFKKDAATERNRNEAGLQLLQSFNAILKRVALLHYPDPELPRLNGRPWLRFLDAQSHTADFTVGVGKVLGEGMYRPVFDADVDALHALCRRWIEQSYLRKQQKKKEQQVAAKVTTAPQASEAKP
jgi:hypothetical protein